MPRPGVRQALGRGRRWFHDWVGRRATGLATMGDAWLGRAVPGEHWWREALAAAMATPGGPPPEPPAGLDELTVLAWEAPSVIQALAGAKYGADGDPWRWLGRRLGLEIRACSAILESSGHRGSPVPVVVPVPSHWWRRWHRGIDHTGLLAIEVASTLGAARRSWLHRWWGPPQVGSDRRVRRNVGDQIGVSPVRWLESRLQRRRRWDPRVPVVLVDDVLTTGASLSACARVLRELGHRTVCGAVIAVHRNTVIDDLSTTDPLDWRGV